MLKYFTLISLLWFCSTMPAFAVDKAGEVSHFEGKVQVFHGGGVRGQTVEGVGTEFAVGDSITTKRGGLAHLALVDGHRVILTENSTLVITGRKTSQVDAGKVLFDIRKRGGVKGFEVTAATVTMGVRGTRFAVSKEQEKVAIHLKEGRLAITSTGGPFQKHLTSENLEEGFKTMQEEMQAQFQGARERLRDQFDESQRLLAAGDMEAVEEIDLEAGSSLMISGREVWQTALPGWIDQDFALFDEPH